MGRSAAVLHLLLLCLLSAARRASGDAGVGLTRGPYLQALLDTSVEVLWRTDLPSVGRVRFAAANEGERTAEEAEAGTAHRVRLPGLSPGAGYRYRVFAGDDPLSAEEFRFRTAPLPGGDPIRVVVAGDSGSGDENQLAVAEVMASLAPDIFVHTGDLDYLGDPDAAIFGPYRRLLAGAALYAARGNHDLHHRWAGVLHPHLEVSDDGPRRHSFDWGSAHFAVLDSNGLFAGEVGESQLAWLAADLEAAKGRPGLAWNILVFHHPPYTVGPFAFHADRNRNGVLDPDEAPDLELRRRIEPTIDHFEVDLVLTGHDHLYARSHPMRDGRPVGPDPSPRLFEPGGTIYVVTGGGGQLHYEEFPSADHTHNAVIKEAYHALGLEIGPALLVLTAVSADLEVLDHLAIEKRGPRPGVRFLRGDVDANGRLEIADPILILTHLFLGGGLDCPLAADLDRSGPPLLINDPVYLLQFLFLGGPAPPEPFPACESAPVPPGGGCVRGGCPPGGP